jgi:heme-binding protein
VRLAALWSFAGLLAVFTVLQLLPYGRDHSNPARHTEPPWDSARTREPVVGRLLRLPQQSVDDVHRGREALDFSLWPGLEEGEEAEVEDIFEVVLDGSMPPRAYALAHSDARLSESEELELVQGFHRTFARAGSPSEREKGSERRTGPSQREGPVDAPRALSVSRS